MLNRHLLGYLPVYLAQILVGFGGVVVFTRLLEPEDYGRYTLILAAMMLAETVLFTWLNAAVARYHARSAARGRIGGHTFTIFRIYALVAAGAAVVLGLTVWLAPIGAELKAALAFAVAALVFRGGMDMALETRRAAGQVGRFAFIQTFSLTAGFALGVVFILAGGLGTAGIFAGLALAAFMACVIDFPILLKGARRDRAGPRRGLAFAAYGAPVAFSLVFEQLLATGDRFLIAAFLGEAATGAYAAGYGITDRSLNIMFVWLGAAATPLAIAALERQGRAAAQDMARQAAALMGLIGFPAAAGLALVAEPFARLLIAEALAADAASIMGWIALGSLLNGIMTYFFHEAFILGRKPARMAGLMVAGAVLNIALNLLLIPAFGLVGAAVATVIAYGVSLVACAVAGRFVFPLKLPVEDWTKAALATAAMAVVLIALPAPASALLHLLSHVVAGAAVYGALAIMLDIAGCRSAMALPLIRRFAGVRP
jgi:O-antigen/teichoic acid export membrane protein